MRLIAAYNIGRDSLLTLQNEGVSYVKMARFYKTIKLHPRMSE